MIHEAFGSPGQVCRVEEAVLPAIADGEVRVRMVCAPVNPADLNLVEGTYGRRPSLPCVPGGEGAGRVVESRCDQVPEGALVLVPGGCGAWSEYVQVAGERVWVVPSGIAAEQACMLRVNPATAWRMLHDFVPLERGEWVIQNAANSGVGRAVAQIGAHCGWRVVNVVRRPELLDAPDLPGVVLLDDDALVERVREVTGGARLRLALNAVGGESALRLAKVLGEGGTLVTYGAMGRQPVRIPNGMLIFGDLRLRGFWVTRWYEAAEREEAGAMLGGLFELAKRGVLQTPVERAYPLELLSEALERAREGGRSGKVLLALGPDAG